MPGPSVQDTINILRGLSPKYSSYHGVRIADRALVAAAELSDRYIQGRFLPDKAIDLVRAFSLPAGVVSSMHLVCQRCSCSAHHSKYPDCKRPIPC